MRLDIDRQRMADVERPFGLLRCAMRVGAIRVISSRKDYRQYVLRHLGRLDRSRQFDGPMAETLSSVVSAIQRDLLTLELLDRAAALRLFDRTTLVYEAARRLACRALRKPVRKALVNRNAGRRIRKVA